MKNRHPLRTVQVLRIILFAAGLFLCHFTAKSQLPYSGAPEIRPPYVTAAHPGTELIYAIPTTGERPMGWKVKGLPEGLALDPGEGIIRGTVAKAGTYEVEITARNPKGRDRSTLTIRIGDELAPTPIMGWNSWNTFGTRLSEELLIETADAMILSGMRDLGYNYICIDDLWQLRERGTDGHIVVDKEKFPNGLRYVADYLHDRGLHLGIYSDASPLTCANVCGSYGHEQTDAADFAAWGVDLLKYDYCHAPAEKDTALVRYTAMGNALRDCGRSIVFSVCEWGGRQPWLWAKSVGGHYWRTTGDIGDFWTRPEGSPYSGIFDIIRQNAPLATYAGPGAWNDPDMLVVGLNGVSGNINHGDMKYGCTPTEYRTHMSLWCMMAAPLLCGNDIRDMDVTTRAILLNPEIIAINQDALGRQANIVSTEGPCSFWVKPLSGGKTAVAVFNESDKPAPATIDLQKLGIGKGRVRDVWARHDLGKRSGVNLLLGPHACEVFVIR